MLPQYLALAGLAVAVAIMTCGVGAAWAARNLAKRISALLVAAAGAVLALAALGGSDADILAGVAVALAQTLVGLALLTRVHEHYGSSEIPDIDASDAQREPSEPDA